MVARRPKQSVDEDPRICADLELTRTSFTLADRISTDAARSFDSANCCLFGDHRLSNRRLIALRSRSSRPKPVLVREQVAKKLGR